jgi:hypothetical protein
VSRFRHSKAEHSRLRPVSMYTHIGLGLRVKGLGKYIVPRFRHSKASGMRKEPPDPRGNGSRHEGIALAKYLQSMIVLNYYLPGQLFLNRSIIEGSHCQIPAYYFLLGLLLFTWSIIFKQINYYLLGQVFSKRANMFFVGKEN